MTCSIWTFCEPCSQTAAVSMEKAVSSLGLVRCAHRPGCNALSVRALRLSWPKVRMLCVFLSGSGLVAPWPSLFCMKAALRNELVDRPLQEAWPVGIQERSAWEALDELLEVVEDDRFIQQSQMLICGGGGSPALCLLLRMVTDLPMLITHQAPLSFRMPSSLPRFTN